MQALLTQEQPAWSGLKAKLGAAFVGKVVLRRPLVAILFRLPGETWMALNLDCLSWAWGQSVLLG